VIILHDVEETFGKLNLYLDHLDMDLSEYLSQVITNEMDACVFKKIGPPKKRYCNEFSIDEMVDWAEMEVENPEGVETSTSQQTRAKRSDDDSDYQSDKSVGYLSHGKEELIKLKNRIKANREANAKTKDNPVLEMNEPNDDNNMLADNVRCETFKEHDIYMNELLKSLNTADKDGITKDPFIFV
ncbi:hypothetical protein Tco_0067672, partial [Tanacetum coccineum]